MAWPGKARLVVASHKGAVWRDPARRVIGAGDGGNWRGPSLGPGRAWHGSSRWDGPARGELARFGPS